MIFANERAIASVALIYLKFQGETFETLISRNVLCLL